MNAPKVKTNWLQAFGWTALVSLVTCVLFIAAAFTALHYFPINNNPNQKVERSIASLSKVIESQAKELVKLKQENKKIYDYIQFWVPIDCPRTREEKWVIPGYGLPEIKRRSYLPMCGDEGDKICSPFLELLP
jgi:hypothetical protein